MRAYRKYLTIENPKQVTFSDLPFAAGDCVEVVMIAAESSPAAQVETLHTLLKTKHFRKLASSQLPALPWKSRRSVLDEGRY